MASVVFEMDGRRIEAEEGTSLMDAALAAGIVIPGLCHEPGLKPLGACRLCMVEIEESGGRKRMVASCCYNVKAGLKVRTATPRIEEIRKTLLELVIPQCPTGPLMEMGLKYGITEKDREGRLKMKNPRFPVPGKEPSFCDLCGKCVRNAEKEGCGACTYMGRGVDRRIGLVDGADECMSCRKCFELCEGGQFVTLVGRRESGLGN